MFKTFLRRALTASAALAVAVTVPVLTTGGASASAEPKPVPTAMRTFGFTVEKSTRTLPSPDAAPSEGADATPDAPRELAAPADAATTAPVDVAGGAHVVGVTWDRGAVAAGATVQLREERGGAWGPWQDLDADADEGPDPGTDAADDGRGGTSPWITTADAVQTRIVGDTVGHGRAARFDVVDASTTTADRAVTATPAGAADAASTTPTVYSRAQWGADESIRHAKVYEGVVKAAIVHHTVGSNNYTAAQVPSIIRGIYVFHTTGRGWGDIGYNFLVDRFGRSWEGRYGGITKPMVGAHAAPYNSQTTGVSVLGDFTSATPPAAVPTAVSKLIAWRLGIAGVDPSAKTTLDGYGTSPTVIGHRDVNQTSCPGAKLYAMLPSIRTRAHAYQGTMVYGPSIGRTSYAYGGDGTTVRGTANGALSWKITVQNVCSSTPMATLTGKTSGPGAISRSWNGRDSRGAFVPPGTYRVTLSASSGSGTLATAVPAVFPLTVTSAAGAPPGLCPPRLYGPDRYATAVQVAQAASSSARTVVITSGVDSAIADSLVAAPLARRHDGVMLLSAATGLPSSTRSEIARRKATRAYIVGGLSTVPRAVETQLKALGVGEVTRYYGADRYETAAAVARALGPSPDAFVASGADDSIVDGLVLSGPAGHLERPILLTRPDSLPDATRSALKDLKVRRTAVAGGTTTVFPAVFADLPSPTRLAGVSRWATAAAIGSWASTRVPVQDVVVSSGRQDSLIDMVSSGQLGRVQVITQPTSLPTAVRDFLSRTSGIGGVTVIGGTSSVSSAVGGDAQEATR